MSITNSALLVELNINVWQAQKLDKETTRKVASDNNATEDSGKFHKNLMAGTSLRKDIADYAANCRLWHNTQTLAWSDRGVRILPTSLFMDYKTEFTNRKANFDRMVNDFLVQYPSLVQTAHNYLGTLFKAEDYPNAQEVQRKFGFKLTVSPIASTSDFRLQLAEQEVEEVRKQYEESFNERLAEAAREPWERLHKLLSGMSEKLTEPEGEEENKRRWHATFVSNAQQMVGMLTHLNLANDPKLEQARRDLELTMLGADIEDIKESQEVRKDLKDKVDAILNKFNW
jgi:hypothetical protein